MAQDDFSKHRCEICLEETCGGKRNCDCSSCTKIKECYRYLRPTVRITTKCTQECEHCCFSCSPSRTDMMTVEKAKEIAKFISSNNIFYVNVMGGEFFLNPDWYEIMSCFVTSCKQVRLVTTGDWAIKRDVQKDLLKLKELCASAGNNLAIALSNDKWHLNGWVEVAEDFLKENGFDYAVGEDGDDGNHLVPIGRGGNVANNMFTMFSCYCQNPSKMYSFLIDEVGTIYKCNFGAWGYADITDYLEGGFHKKFKEFNTKFYGIFIPSCSSCIMQYQIRQSKPKK